MAPKVKNILDRIPRKVLIDPEDFHLVSQYTWRISVDNGYVVATTKDNKTIRIHRLILEPKHGNYVDHINHNKLDNRRANLRECSPVLSSCNRRVCKNNKSGFKGVFKITGENYTKPWRAKIAFNGIKSYLGDFKTPEEAAIAYNRAALKIHGKYACINKI